MREQVWLFLDRSGYVLLHDLELLRSDLQSFLLGRNELLQPGLVVLNFGQLVFFGAGQ